MKWNEMDDIFFSCTYIADFLAEAEAEEEKLLLLLLVSVVELALSLSLIWFNPSTFSSRDLGSLWRLKFACDRRWVMMISVWFIFPYEESFRWPHLRVAATAATNDAILSCKPSCHEIFANSGKPKTKVYLALSLSSFPSIMQFLAHHSSWHEPGKPAVISIL